MKASNRSEVFALQLTELWIVLMFDVYLWHGEDSCTSDSAFIHTHRNRYVCKQRSCACSQQNFILRAIMLSSKNLILLYSEIVVYRINLGFEKLFDTSKTISIVTHVSYLITTCNVSRTCNSLLTFSGR